MTTQQPDRLDRVERILEGLATSQQQTDQRIAAMATSQQQTDQRIAAVAEQQQQTQRQLELTRQIADSNARSNQANSEAITELKQQSAIVLQQLRASTEDIVGMITTQAIEAAADRAELRRMVEAMYGSRSNGNGGSQE